MKKFICDGMSVIAIDVHISIVKQGDTVYYNGELKTVCNNNIKYDSFIGYTLFGNSYKLGCEPVQKVIKLNTRVIEPSSLSNLNN